MRSLYSPLAWRLFELAGPLWRRGRLASLQVGGLPAEVGGGGPLLVVANHVSWWDGFLVREVHRRLRPRAPFLTVMLESQLRRHPFLRLLGGMGLDPASPSSLKSLLRALSAEAARRPELMVLYFPQGRIWPSHRRPLGFRPGVRGVREALGACAVLPLGIHLAPGTRPGQDAWLSAAPLIPAGDPAGSDPAELERRVAAELDSLLRFLAEQGEDAPRRWPVRRGDPGRMLGGKEDPHPGPTPPRRFRHEARGETDGAAVPG